MPQIPDFNPLSPPASGDLLAVVDIDASNEVKKSTVAEIVEGAGGLLADGSVAMSGDLDVGANAVINQTLGGQDITAGTGTIPTDADKGGFVYCDTNAAGSDITLTVNGSNVRAVTTVACRGPNDVVLEPDAGVTFLPAGNKTIAPNKAVTLIWVGANEVLFIGDFT